MNSKKNEAKCDLAINWLAEDSQTETEQIKTIDDWLEDNDFAVIAHTNTILWPKPFSRKNYQYLYIWNHSFKKGIFRCEIHDIFRYNANKKKDLPEVFQKNNCLNYQNHQITGQDIQTYFLIKNLNPYLLNNQDVVNMRPSRKGDLQEKFRANPNSIGYIQLRTS